MLQVFTACFMWHSISYQLSAILISVQQQDWLLSRTAASVVDSSGLFRQKRTFHFSLSLNHAFPFVGADAQIQSKSQNLERVRVNIFVALQPQVGLGLFISWSHSDTPHAVALHKFLSDNTQNSQETSMPPAGFKPAMPGSQQPQT
jgi:hypothetical protein